MDDLTRAAIGDLANRVENAEVALIRITEVIERLSLNMQTVASVVFKQTKGVA